MCFALQGKSFVLDRLGEKGQMMCNELTSEIKSFIKESNEEGWLKATGDGWSGRRWWWWWGGVQTQNYRIWGQRQRQCLLLCGACVLCGSTQTKPKFESGSFQDFLFMFFLVCSLGKLIYCHISIKLLCGCARCYVHSTIRTNKTP